MKLQLAGQNLPGPRRSGTVAGRFGPDAVRRRSSDHNSATGYPGKELKKRIIVRTKEKVLNESLPRKSET